MTDILGTGISVTDAGAGGLLLVFVALLFLALHRGTLVTGKSHDEQLADLRKSYDEQLTDLRRTHAEALADRDRQIVDWRDAYRASDARGDLVIPRMDQVLEFASTSAHALTAISQAAQANSTAPDSTGGGTT